MPDIRSVRNELIQRINTYQRFAQLGDGVPEPLLSDLRTHLINENLIDDQRERRRGGEKATI